MDVTVSLFASVPPPLITLQLDLEGHWLREKAPFAPVPLLSTVADRHQHLAYLAEMPFRDGRGVPMNFLSWEGPDPASEQGLLAPLTGFFWASYLTQQRPMHIIYIIIIL